jgi:23S rRNA pseudouridine2605 synthase
VIRLAPYIAQRAPLSRRQAEQAIKMGRITVDGVVATDFYAESFTTIGLDGTDLLLPPPPKMWIYYKPVGELVTRFDPQGRPTVFDALRPQLPEGPLVCVGRLDYESEGLLLLTNAPSVAHSLEKGRLNRCYRVWVRGQLTDDRIKALENGMTIEDIYYRPCRIIVERQSDGCSQVLVTLTEGKKREIRVLMSAVNQHVTRLMRISFGPFRLGGLVAGNVIPVADEAVNAFLASVEEEKKRLSQRQPGSISHRTDGKPRSVLSPKFPGDRRGGGRSEYSGRNEEVKKNAIKNRWEKRAPKEREEQTAEGKPSYGSSAPRSDSPRPAYGSSSGSRPAYGSKPRSFGEGKPSYGSSAPRSDSPRPAYGSSSGSRPAYGSSAPRSDSPRPAYGSSSGSRPAYGSSAPRSDSPRPAYGSKPRSFGESKPAYGSSSGSRPAYGSSAPRSDSPRPAYGSSSGSRPAYGSKPRSFGEGKPSYGSSAPRSDSPRPAYGAPRTSRPGFRFTSSPKPPRPTLKLDK